MRQTSDCRGSYIPTLVIDPRTPSTVYAGGSGGVFKSTDSGGEWSTPGFPTDYCFGSGN